MSREMQVLLNYELLPPAKIMGQVSGYHPIKTLDPDFILPVLRRDRFSNGVTDQCRRGCDNSYR